MAMNALINRVLSSTGNFMRKSFDHMKDSFFPILSPFSLINLSLFAPYHITMSVCMLHHDKYTL